MTSVAAQTKRFALTGAARFATGGLLLIGGALVWSGIGGGFAGGLGSLFGLGQHSAQRAQAPAQPRPAPPSAAGRLTHRARAAHKLSPSRRRAHHAPQSRSRVPVATNPSRPAHQPETAPPQPPAPPRKPTGGGAVGGAVETVTTVTKPVTQPLPAPVSPTVDQVSQTVLNTCAGLPGGCP